MIRNACIILVSLLMLCGCIHKAAVQLIASPESALQVANTYLAEQKVDTTRHDMSKPEGVQEITLENRKAWRVSWKLRDFTGKGGQFIVIVDETGTCQHGWGE
jgi:hypothetical protein